MILWKNVNEEASFLTVHLDYSIIGIVFTLLAIGILSVYVAVSYDYPQIILWLFGAAVVWIVVGWNDLCLIVTILAQRNFFWKYSRTVPTRLVWWFFHLFYNPNLVASAGLKTGLLMNITLFQPSEFVIPFI